MTPFSIPISAKSGLYKYYKCTRRQNHGNHASTSANLPLEKLDDVVLNRLVEKVLAPEHLHILVVELRKHIKPTKDGQQERIHAIHLQIKQTEKRQENLLDAIKTGVIELDDIVQHRTQQLKATCDALFVEMVGVRRDHALPAVEHLKSSQVDSFGQVPRQKLLAKDSGLVER